MKNLHHFVVPRWVVNFTGGGNPAILFARILYWHRADKNGVLRLGPDEDGRPRAWCPGYQGIERENGAEQTANPPRSTEIGIGETHCTAHTRRRWPDHPTPAAIYEA